MQLVNDSKDPQLVAIVDRQEDVDALQRQVSNINQWLVDSGFDQYQFAVVKKGKRAYIEQV